MTTLQRRERERAQRRQVIVDAARQLAEAEGWESVTTRRLADAIEYSQPVLYSHFDGKDAIVSAVALEGFSELAALLLDARAEADSAAAQPRAVATAYMEFARTNPALYEAMFTLVVDLTFAQTDTPAPLHAAFVELLEALAPFAGDHDVETFTEVVWSALHGLATLSRAGRLRPAFYDQRLATLIDQLGPARVEHGNLTNDHGDRTAGGAALPKEPASASLTGSSKRSTRKRQ
jgi:AcrR family transcriptional regulator